MLESKPIPRPADLHAKASAEVLSIRPNNDAEADAIAWAADEIRRIERACAGAPPQSDAISPSSDRMSEAASQNAAAPPHA